MQDYAQGDANRYTAVLHLGAVEGEMVLVSLDKLMNSFMKDFSEILGHMREVYAKAQEVQKELVRLEAVGEAGAGAVKATVNGKKALLKLEIDPEYIDPNEKKILQDLIVAAINLAHKDIEEKRQVVMKQYTGGLLEGLPVDFLW